MDFVNFWVRDITLAASASTCPIDLPDGSYRLTIADSATAAAAWEIVGAVVDSGTATLTRELEGTTARDWLAGSVVMCSITAGGLANLFALIADLEQRVAALEAGGGGLPDGALVDELGNTLTDAAGNTLTTGA